MLTHSHPKRRVVCLFNCSQGNGTQDILCSTYDPRFLYVSMHAGGPEVNGVNQDDDPNHELGDLGGKMKSSGIFPGRCGDTSPHPGVLNIPLGARVKPFDVGSALIRLVTPAVESFSPDLIILSAGFDAHKNDPMCLGNLSAEDFGHITEVACQLAHKLCSGRVISVLEGGYGVPCCRAQRDDQIIASSEADKISPPILAMDQSDTVKASLNSEQSENAIAFESLCQPCSDSKPSADLGLSTQQEANAEERQATSATDQAVLKTTVATRPQPSRLLDLGGDLPDTMDDQVPLGLQRRLEKCHTEGFIECVCEHVRSLGRCSKRK